MPSAFAIVLTTVATEADAARLARQLLESGLAACVQIDTIRSLYRWKGELHDEPEWRLSIKTRADRYPELEEFIRTHHPYQTPEIVRIDIAAGSSQYLAWIDDCLKPLPAK